MRGLPLGGTGRAAPEHFRPGGSCRMPLPQMLPGVLNLPVVGGGQGRPRPLPHDSSVSPLLTNHTAEN